VPLAKVYVVLLSDGMVKIMLDPAAVNLYFPPCVKVILLVPESVANVVEGKFFFVTVIAPLAS